MSNPATQRPVPPPHVQYERVRRRLIQSCAINNPGLTHACVTASVAFGCGVFSWHTSAWAAEHNAALTGGQCVRVERDEHGEVVLPEAAVQALEVVIG